MYKLQPAFPLPLLRSILLYRHTRLRAVVLIYGETGTGKELVAESIHTSSPGKGKLHRGGAEKRGCLNWPTRGRCFWIRATPWIFLYRRRSSRCWRKKVRRIGGSEDIHIDIKILCAMNEDPYEVLKEGKIREDLFYRTGVVQIKLPPLRERREDIMPLTEAFIERFNRELNRDIQMIDEEKLSLSEAVDQYEKELIKRVLERSKNMAEAAKRLKLSRQSLKYKMEKHGI